MLAMAAMIPSCKKFDSLTVSPTAATSEQVQVEYLLTNSIVGAQMDPHIAERVFVLYWRNASHQQLGSTVAIGSDDDGWTSDSVYFKLGRSYYFGVTSEMGGMLESKARLLKSESEIEKAKNIIKNEKN